MPGVPPARIVLIDSGQEPLSGLAQILKDAGFAVTHAHGGLDGLVAVEEVRPALVFLPWSLSFIYSEIVVGAIRTGLADPPAIVGLTNDGEDPADILRAGADVVLPFSVDAETLLRAVCDRLA